MIIIIIIIRTSYYDRLKKLLKSKLNAGNLMKAINCWAVASVRYSAAIVDWTKEELRQFDRKTRKLLTMHGGLHPKSDIDRLYLPRKLGGRGICSIEDCVEEERRSIATYLSQNQEELLKFARKELKLPTENESKLEFKNRKEKIFHLGKKRNCMVSLQKILMISKQMSHSIGCAKGN